MLLILLQAVQVTHQPINRLGTPLCKPPRSANLQQAVK
jgi:hypothetical protein